MIEYGLVAFEKEREGKEGEGMKRSIKVISSL